MPKISPEDAELWLAKRGLPVDERIIPELSLRLTWARAANRGAEVADLTKAIEMEGYALGWGQQPPFNLKAMAEAVRGEADAAAAREEAKQRKKSEKAKKDETPDPAKQPAQQPGL